MKESIEAEIIRICQEGIKYCNYNDIDYIEDIEDIFINILNLLTIELK